MIKTAVTAVFYLYFQIEDNSMEEKNLQMMKEPDYVSQIIKLIRSNLPREEKLEFLEDYVMF